MSSHKVEAGLKGGGAGRSGKSNNPRHNRVTTIPKDPDPRNLMYLKFVDLQRYGTSSDEIAAYFKRSSAKDVFAELKAYGFPVCAMCGANPVVGKHCSKERKPRQLVGERVELPPIANAVASFRDSIATLEHYLEQSLSLKEFLQGQHFIGEGETEETNVRELRGAQWHPHPHVVALITASILAHQGDWGFVTRLLNELHPSPSEANRKQLYRLIYGARNTDTKGNPTNRGDGLVRRANRIAELVRGKRESRAGAKNPDIPASDQYLATLMQSLVDKGLSREEVEQTFREDLEAWRKDALLTLREDLEQAKSTDDQEYVEELEEEIHRVKGEKHDESEFDRIWKLSKDLR